MSDTTKQQVLDALYTLRNEKQSVAMMAVGVREIQQKSKELYGLKRQDVAQALDYLIQHGWVDQIEEQRTVARGRMTIPTVQSKYRLSATGLALYEGESRFNALNRYSGINIENIGGVVVMGNNNVVNNKFRDLYANLDTLENKIKLTDGLSEDEKLAAAADIQTVKDQLTKNVPDRTIVDTAMSVVRHAAEVAGAIELWDRIHGLIGTLF